MYKWHTVPINGTHFFRATIVSNIPPGKWFSTIERCSASKIKRSKILKYVHIVPFNDRTSVLKIMLWRKSLSAVSLGTKEIPWCDFFACEFLSLKELSFFFLFFFQRKLQRLPVTSRLMEYVPNQLIYKKLHAFPRRQVVLSSFPFMGHSFDVGQWMRECLLKAVLETASRADV